MEAAGRGSERYRGKGRQTGDFKRLIMVDWEKIAGIAHDGWWIGTYRESTQRLGKVQAQSDEQAIEVKATEGKGLARCEASEVRMRQEALKTKVPLVR